ncbi:MAG: hypothetical protein KDA60_04860, partial [Planctomycetales bacterium]|nr:hypothetical protein [Planctomycetales bacterium]
HPFVICHLSWVWLAYRATQLSQFHNRNTITSGTCLVLSPGGTRLACCFEYEVVMWRIPFFTLRVHN